LITHQGKRGYMREKEPNNWLNLLPKMRRPDPDKRPPWGKKKGDFLLKWGKRPSEIAGEPE